MMRLDVRNGTQITTFLAAMAVLISGALFEVATAQNRGMAASRGAAPASRLSTRPATTAASTPVDVLASLNRNIHDVKFSKTPLGEAFMQLAAVGGSPIVVDWNALKAVSVNEQTPVTLTLRDFPLSVVLSIVLQQTAPGKLEFKVAEDAIHVTTLAPAPRPRGGSTTVPAKN